MLYNQYLALGLPAFTQNTHEYSDGLWVQLSITIDTQTYGITEYSYPKYCGCKFSSTGYDGAITNIWH